MSGYWIMNRKMMKRYFLMLFLSVVSAMNAAAQFREGTSYQELYDSETVTLLKSHVRQIAAVQLEGRKAGSDGEKMAAEYVASLLKEAGVELITPQSGDTFGVTKEN